MKKFVLILMLFSLVLCFCACGATQEASNSSQESEKKQELNFMDPNAIVPNYGDLAFESNGERFGIFDEIDAVVASIGEPVQTSEAASCAYQGMDYFYFYNGFELTVNEFNGVKRITKISIVDDTVQIPQGVKIGMATQDALDLMPDNYAESTGIYSFTSGSCMLRMQEKDGVIVSITYSEA